MAMGPTYFLANPGSTTRKYALFSGGKAMCTAKVDPSQPERIVIKKRVGRDWVIAEGDVRSTEDPLISAWEWLAGEARMRGLSGIDAGGIRLVAPGSRFQTHLILDGDAIAALQSTATIAPLHLGPALLEISTLLPLLAGQPLVGVSDSAFHATLPPQARTYAIPPADAERLDLYRFGYHGLSVRSVIRKVPALLGSLPDRMVVCHLGGGSSITAVLLGKAVDTSMGYSPLEGLIMGTRPGDMDPAAVLRLAEDKVIGSRGIGRYLQERCGLLGLSGKSGEMLTLLALEQSGDSAAAFALEAYVYRVRKTIGAYAAALSGLDLLVFTGGIGEGAPAIRERICAGLEFLGISLDSGSNRTLSDGALLHPPGSAVSIAVVATDEMAEMAIEVETALQAEEAMHAKP